MTPSQQLEQDTDFVIQRADREVAKARTELLRAQALAAALRLPKRENVVQLVVR